MTPPVVIKVGGSLLRDAASYEALARLLVDRIRAGPTWVVVSAARGVTDDLDRLAREGDPQRARSLLERQSRIAGIPCDPSLERELREALEDARRAPPDRLLAWGERASTAALRAHLSRLGADVPVVELVAGAPLPLSRSALVPGFFLVDRTGRVRCLPRGGSDISAVLVASAAGARRVQLWKEGGGIRSDGGTLPEVDAAAVLPRLRGTIRPLHPAAVRLAARHEIELVLEDPWGGSPPTLILPHCDLLAPGHPSPAGNLIRLVASAPLGVSR